jgi:Tfp pilus assembly protein PilN
VRRITLLPAEVVERRAQRRQVSMVAAALAGLAVLLLGLFLLRNGRVADAREGADREEARTRTLQQEEGTFARVEAIQADVAGRRATAVAALSGDVAWTRVVQEIAGAMPNDVWLTSFDGQTDAASGTRTITFSAMGFDQTSTARWIQRLEEVPLVDDVWVSSSTSSGDAGRPLVTFSSDASLTEAARSDRADRLPGGEGR